MTNVPAVFIGPDQTTGVMKVKTSLSPYDVMTEDDTDPFNEKFSFSSAWNLPLLNVASIAAFSLPVTNPATQVFIPMVDLGYTPFLLTRRKEGKVFYDDNLVHISSGNGDAQQSVSVNLVNHVNFRSFAPPGIDGVTGGTVNAWFIEFRYGYDPTIDT